ncbi:MAG: PilZ domain-containing protein [Cyanobacteriota bacterium]|nr:PilZ domain-containing protein [Cyanobacteriota bacterium]
MLPFDACSLSAQRGASATPVSPPCQLRLEGAEGAPANCQILELSSEGVNIAVKGGQGVRSGQQGRLLIGPPEGDHYELPVAVSWVEPDAPIAVLGLAFPSSQRWVYSRC